MNSELFIVQFPKEIPDEEKEQKASIINTIALLGDGQIEKAKVA
jgi:hypothetical protein